MTPHALLFTLAAIGISETTYLIRERLNRRKPVCLVGTECSEVLESRYNRFLGISNDVLGLVFYIIIALGTALLVIGVRVPVLQLDRLVELSIGAGVGMSAIFTYIQWRVIRVWCFWCLMSALTIVLMAVVVLTNTLNII